MLKYNANPDKYSSHEQILAMLQELPAGASVLKVGGASGDFGDCHGLVPKEQVQGLKGRYQEIPTSEGHAFKT